MHRMIGLVLGVMVAVAVLPTQPAGAQTPAPAPSTQPPQTIPEDDAGEADVSGGVSRNQGSIGVYAQGRGETTPAPPATSGAGPVQIALDYFDEASTAPDGLPCIGSVGVPAGTPNIPVRVGGVAALAGLGYEPCPTTPGPPALPDPASYARAYSDTLPLPVPDPHVAPGEMIVGWRAFMETGVDLTVRFADTTPFGPISIEATGQLNVDWDDGDGWAGPYDDPGSPYPDGRVWNIYIDDGSYDIEVVVEWTADWVFLGQTGTITDGLATSGTLADFPVYEAQAVIGSGGG